MLIPQAEEHTWQVATSDYELYSGLTDPTYVLEEIIGLPASLIRRQIRLARIQGPTIVSDGVILVPPTQPRKD